MSARLPRSFRRGHDDSIACKHRDLSCCVECLAKHIELVDVLGRVYWVPNESERKMLIDESARIRAQWQNQPRRPQP